jgi:hypothetical protein
VPLLLTHLPGTRRPGGLLAAVPGSSRPHHRQLPGALAKAAGRCPCCITDAAGGRGPARPCCAAAIGAARVRRATGTYPEANVCSGERCEARRRAWCICMVACSVWVVGWVGWGGVGVGGLSGCLNVSGASGLQATPAGRCVQSPSSSKSAARAFSSPFWCRLEGSSVVLLHNCYPLQARGANMQPNCRAAFLASSSPQSDPWQLRQQGQRRLNLGSTTAMCGRLS